MHIDLKICHFLLFTLSIAEAGKSKNKGETGIHGPSLCRGSTTKQFLFHRVLKKNSRKLTFLGASHGNWHSTYSRLEDPKADVFDNFWGTPQNKNGSQVLPQHGDGPWMPVFSLFVDFPASEILTVNRTSDKFLSQ